MGAGGLMVKSAAERGKKKAGAQRKLNALGLLSSLKRQIEVFGTRIPKKVLMGFKKDFPVPCPNPRSQSSVRMGFRQDSPVPFPNPRRRATAQELLSKVAESPGLLARGVPPLLGDAGGPLAALGRSL